MENPTGKKVGKLYALFLEASKEYVKSKLHQELKLPEESGEIYRQLVRRTRGGDNTKYNVSFGNIKNYQMKIKGF